MPINLNNAEPNQEDIERWKKQQESGQIPDYVPQTITAPPAIEYEWKVIYKDGTILEQKYNTSEEKNYGDIDLPNVKRFEFSNGDKTYGLDLETGEFELDYVKLRCALDNNTIPKNIKLNFFRRTAESYGPYGRQTRNVFMFGWEADVEGQMVSRWVFIMPDGQLVLKNSR